MAKYKVGDELIIVNDPTEEAEKLKELTHLSVEDNFAQLTWGIKILNVEYDKPNITLNEAIKIIPYSNRKEGLVITF